MDETEEQIEEQQEESSPPQEQQTDDRQERCNQQTSPPPAGGRRCASNCVVAYPQDVVLAATSLALALSKGRNQYEIETLINLFSLTTNNLQAILAQILINKRTQDFLETPL